MMNKRKWAGWAASLPVGIFFLMAAISKLTDPTPVTRLLSQLPASAFLPHTVRNIVQGALVGAEIYVGVALVVRRSIHVALPTAITLLAFFSVAVAPYYEGLGGDCGCVWRWIPLTPETGLGIILRNLSFALLLGFSAWSSGSGGPRERRQCLWVGSAYLLCSAVAISLWGGLSGWSPPRLDVSPSLTPESPSAPPGTADLSPLTAGSASAEAAPRTNVLIPDSRGDEGASMELRQILIVDSLSKEPLVAAAVRFARDIEVYAIQSGSGMFSQQEPTEHETDRFGVVSVPQILLTEELIGTAIGYEPARLNVNVEPLRLELKPAAGPQLVLRDGFDRPVPGARVAMRGSEYWVSGRAASGQEYIELGLSSAEGEFRLPRGLPRLYTLLVQADGGAIARIDQAKRKKQFMLELRDRAPIRGSVRGYDDTRDLMVHAMCTRPKSAVPLVAPVAQNGEFVFPAAGSGLSYQITLGRNTPSGFAPFSGSVEVVAPSSGVEIAMADTFSLSGEFHSKQPGREISKPSVLTSSSRLDVLVGPETIDMRKTGESRWTWSGIPLPASGEAYLWVVAEGHTPKMAGKHIISPGSSIELGRLDLAPLVPWSIEVTEEPGGAPVPEAYVTFLPDDATSMQMTAYVQRAKTGTVGRCVLDQPAASGELIVRKVGWADTRLRLEQDGDGFAETVRVSLTRSARIRLTVVGTSGERVPEASIRWKHAVSGINEDVELDRTGTGTLAVPGGDVQVSYAPEMVRRRVGSLTSKARSQTASEAVSVLVEDLLPGELRIVELQVPVLAKWRVKLEDGEGRALAGYQVLAIAGEGLSLDDIASLNSITAPFGVTDADGIAELRNVPIGVVSLFMEEPAQHRRWRRVIVLDTREAITRVPLMHRDVEVSVKDGAGAQLPGVAIKVDIVWGGRRFMGVFDSVSGEGGRVSRAGPVRLIQFTNAEGSALFKDLPDGCNLIFRSAEPSLFPTLAPVTLLSGDRRVLVAMALSTGASLTIRDPNYGGQQTVVWLQSEAGLQSLELDSKGEACFYGLAPGQFVVQVVPIDWNTEIYLKPGEERLEVVPPN